MAADDGELELSTRSRSGTRSPGSTRSPVPEAVQNLELVQSRKGEPSANLKWELPANLVRSQDVSHYIVRVSSGVSNKVLWEMEVDGGKTQVDFPEDKYLEPLCPYIFGVQAKNSNYVTGDWSMLDGCIGEYRLVCEQTDRARVQEDNWGGGGAPKRESSVFWKDLRMIVSNYSRNFHAQQKFSLCSVCV